MEKIKKYEVTRDTYEYAFGYEESKDGDFMKCEDVEERLREVRSRSCMCDYTIDKFKCNSCRIIEELFGDIGEDLDFTDN